MTNNEIQSGNSTQIKNPKGLEYYLLFQESIIADENDISPWKILFSRSHKLFALYLLFSDDEKNKFYFLQDVFHNYCDASHHTMSMIDNSHGMKEKINNFFN